MGASRDLVFMRESESYRNGYQPKVGAMAIGVLVGI